MTTKTQIAMFAIATVAIMSFGLTPAFAVGHALVMTAPSSGTDTDDKTSRSICNGTGSVTSEALVRTSPEDYLEVIVDATDCQSHTNTSVWVTVDGNFFGSGSTTSDYKKYTFSGNIDVGDKIIVSVTYTT